MVEREGFTRCIFAPHRSGDACSVVQIGNPADLSNPLRGFKSRLHPILKQRVVYAALCYKMAEREGFEPPDGCPSTVFKTAALNHSATSPMFNCTRFAAIRNS